MRIFVDIRHLTSPEPSGVGEYTTQLLRALFEIDKNNEYVLFSSGRTKPFCFVHHDKVKFVHLPTSNKLLNVRTAFLHHPTINWHVHEPIDLIFLPNLNFVSLPDDIPTVLTVHDLSWKLFPEFYSRKMQLWHRMVRPEKLFGQSSQLITPSESTAQDLQDVFRVESTRITTIPHGIDSRFSPKMEARDHGVRSRYKLPKRFALFVGTLEPRKNLLGLIEGIKQYRLMSRDDLSLVFVGKWGWRSTHLRHRLWKRDVKDWVHHLGYVPPEDRPALYRSARVLTWPSFYEGFGLPVLEAMASGTPVIASRTSSLPELTQDAAILVDPYNPTDIAEALSQLLRSQPLQQRLKERGIARAAEFSWKKTAEKTLESFTKARP